MMSSSWWICAHAPATFSSSGGPYRSRAPTCTSSRSQDASSCPSGTGYGGRLGATRCRSNAHSAASRAAVATASGWARCRTSISAPDLRWAVAAPGSQPSMSSSDRRARTAASAAASSPSCGRAWWTLPVATSGRPAAAARSARAALRSLSYGSPPSVISTATLPGPKRSTSRSSSRRASRVRTAVQGSVPCTGHGTGRRLPLGMRAGEWAGRGHPSPRSAWRTDPLRQPVSTSQSPSARAARSSRSKRGTPLRPPARCASAIAADSERYPRGPRASTSRWVARGSGVPVGSSGSSLPRRRSSGVGRCSSAPNTVARSARRAASAKRTTPYSPSWSVSASASRPSRTASATSSSGWLAPSRKLKAEWACSSA